jgi:hypothetical protein
MKEAKDAAWPFSYDKAAKSTMYKRRNHSLIECGTFVPVRDAGKMSDERDVSGAVVQQGGETTPNKLLISLVCPAGLEPATRPL